MSLYFNYPINAPFKAITVSTAWHPLHAMLAVSSNNGAVTCYTEEGEHFEDMQIQRNCDALQLAWNPTQKILAMGWQDGAVTTWFEGDKTSKEDTSVHQAPLSLLQWSPDGVTLVTGDQEGVVGIWRVNNQGRIAPVSQHRTKSPVTHCTFRTGQFTVGSNECPPFVVGGSMGICYSCNDSDMCVEAFSAGAAVSALLYYKRRDVVVVLTKTMVLAQYQEVDGKFEQVSKAKLSAATSDANPVQAQWVGAGFLSTASNELMLRVWNLDQDDHYVLSLDVQKSPNDRITCAAFNAKKQILAAGTREGNVIMWRYVGEIGMSAASSENWEFLFEVSLGSRVISIQWGAGDNLLHAVKTDGVSILSETVLHRRIREATSVFQLAPDRLAVEKVGQTSALFVKSTSRIKDLDLTKRNLVTWNGKKAEVYEIGETDIQLTTSFNTTASTMAIASDYLFLVKGEQEVDVCDFSGSSKQTLAFADQEGEPFLVDAMGDYMAVATRQGWIRVFDVSQNEIKVHADGRKFAAPNAPEGATHNILSVRCSCDGMRVSILATEIVEDMEQPDTKIYVYEVESDSFRAHDFRSSDHYPISHYWDATEPKLLGCETRSVKAANSDDAHIIGDSEVATLFATGDDVLLQDSFRLEKQYERLLGLHVPHIFFSSKPTDDATGSMAVPTLKNRVMRDFVGMENADKTTMDAMMNFSYCLTMGNMDEAYRAVRLIKSPTVWQNMANMCVKTKRIDVAEVCLGNMSHARAAAALRDARKDESLPLEAQIAVVAVQLGMIEDAEKLYVSCGRYDLLNELYRYAGRWDRSIEIAKKHDRINLHTTFYLYAKYLESIGDTANAVKAYEQSETHRYEVPRMLFDAKNMEELERYINSAEDPALFKWWAKYCESTRSFDKAMMYYSKAQDYLSLVRLHCFLGNLQKAQEIVAESNNESAAYHLARQLESQNKIREAIQMFSKAQRFNHAVRLAKEHEMDADLTALAIQSTKPIMVDAARYFESKGLFDKAVMLYQKGGNLQKALDLCFHAKLFDSLGLITGDIGTDTDPELLARCADFFLQNGQHAKAVQIFVTSKSNLEKALDLCIEYKITITDEMAEAMTPPKGESAAENERRIELLKKLAKCCKMQGSYHLATKKYTQAGEKVKAMKALLRSGDTEKIIFFAGVCKQRDVFILAANYLQTLDWRSDPEIIKNIIGFYTKAKSFESLAIFYDVCAQAEMDEYQNFEKALGALRESQKYLNKARIPDKDQKLAALNQRIHLLEQFTKARKIVKSDPEEMIKICRQLIDEPDIETALRIGDVFALLIEYFFNQQQNDQAYQYLEKMRVRVPNLGYYVSQEMVQAICTAVGAEAPIVNDAAPAEDAEPNPDEVGEEIGEEIAEEDD